MGFTTLRGRMHAGDRRGEDEEVLDNVGDEAALLRFGRLADQGAEIKLALSEALKRRVGDLAEAFRLDLADDACLDARRGAPLSVHLAEELLKEVRGEHLADHIEDLVRPELVLDL